MRERETLSASATERGSRNLVMRIIAALVLAPAATAIAYVGGWPWIILVTLAAIGLYIEWVTIVGGREARVLASGGSALAIAGICLALGSLGVSLLVLGIGLALTAALSPDKRHWIAAGFLYAAAAEVASALARSDHANGFVALMFVLLIVWGNDIGGYVLGRGIGGPKLWPRVSPNKTWAGAVGGFVAGTMVALGFVVAGLGKATPLLTLAAILSVASQLGDLFESSVKRRFGVKDSSHLIPGHGGLMDRLDGFVAAIVVAAIVGILRGGVDGVGRGLMIW